MKVFEVFIILSVIGYACANSSSGDQQYGWNHNQDRDCCKGVTCCYNMKCAEDPPCKFDQDAAVEVASRIVAKCTCFYIRLHNCINGTTDALTLTELNAISVKCISQIFPDNVNCAASVSANIDGSCWSSQSTEHKKCVDSQIHTFITKCAFIC